MDSPLTPLTLSTPKISRSGNNKYRFSHVNVIIFVGFLQVTEGLKNAEIWRKKESLIDYDLKDKVVNLNLVRLGETFVSPPCPSKPFFLLKLFL